MMNTRRFMLSVGLASACIASLVGCGAASTPTPPAPTAASPAPASSIAAPSAAASAIAAVGATCTPIQVKFDPKATGLTGTWAGDDGGVYYVRQMRHVIWWNGMSSRARTHPRTSAGNGTTWVGARSSPISRSVSDWVDVPRGGIDGYGTVTFKIGPDAAGNLQITKTSETGTGRGDASGPPARPASDRRSAPR